MNSKEYNVKALNDTYKNAHIALQSISDLLPSVTDESIKAELQEEYEGYEKIIGELSSLMAEKGIEPQDISPMKKAMLWSSIKMKTLIDNSRNQVAEMMINGTVMGINELTAMINESEKLEPDVKEKIQALLDLEEKYEQKLKTFL